MTALAAVVALGLGACADDEPGEVTVEPTDDQSDAADAAAESEEDPVADGPGTAGEQVEVRESVQVGYGDLELSVAVRDRDGTPTAALTVYDTAAASGTFETVQLAVGDEVEVFDHRVVAVDVVASDAGDTGGEGGLTSGVILEITPLT